MPDMLAAVYERLGAARDVLDVRRMPRPEPGPGEVRVRLRLSGVNPSDWRARLHGRGTPLQWQIPHSDGVGVVDAVGPGADPGRIGSRVWVWNAAWRRRHGTAAQWTCVPDRQAVNLPEHVGDELAAGLGIPFTTAWHALFADGPLDGATVLVAGGAGAVGNAAVQLASRAGATVLATASTDEKARLARAAGASVVVDYRSSEAAAALRAAAPDGVGRILELALGRNLDLDLEVLADHGTVVVYAPEPEPPPIPVQRLMARNLRTHFLLVYTIGPRAQEDAVRGITAALEDGALTPLPTVWFPLHEVAAAHEAVEGGVLGKVVLGLPE
ncbi:oxidoreductase, zinc-binding dehydrogenase family [Rhodococcus aetherivorans]|uniref:Oxidoreductase, zinc-binding dehydrogenase family n=2 Tax=Rhodococcus aetherivorans TaxID=191292 RepID=A0ABQ0YVT8_9NOCA|nr:Alcohol dehydrogenase zinc-binding domain protein [Rhodococcus rhodochrous ATCC 21198]GES40677.1 oxidoreductase, zinc-binding dehydrogenase family [Rhodococcus aetherivorans]